MRVLVILGVMVLFSALLVTSMVSDARAQQEETADSLPSVEGGARPGPDVLYAPKPEAPQLQNRDPRFEAEPLLVSGNEAYVGGEYMYQDFLYDDYGSNTDGQGEGSRSAQAGDITYPTDESRYAGNAADLVEFRIASEPDRVTYRITLNTLQEADSTIVALAFDTDRDADTGTDTLPRDPGADFKGTDEVITTWGAGAQHTAFNDAGQTIRSNGVDVETDLEANQLTITVPREVSDPDGTWRTTVASGLYDSESGDWLRPKASADEENPGGAGPKDSQPSGIFNQAFRFDEPVLEENTPPDTEQASALADHDATRFAHDIDFDALDAGVNRSSVPDSGTQVRIFPSRLDLGEGRDLSADFPQYRGQLQPYSLYVPTDYEPGESAGFTLQSHSLGQEHWQYNGSKGVQQIGEDRDNLVATAMARGPDGWYEDTAEYDVFEMWNDVASNFSLDPERTAISGYSMGGLGTYRLGTLYPDLFGKAFTTVGPPGKGIWQPPAPPTRGIETLTNLWLENARNVPYMNVAAAEDELVPFPGPRAQNLGAPELDIRGFEQLGYRFRFLVYPTADHFTLAALDYDFPMATDFLGEARVDRDPPHISFAYVPASDNANLGLVHDHAYWVSGVELADNRDEEEQPAKGSVDAFSHAFGLGDPPSKSGADSGEEPLPYKEFNRTWGPQPEIPAANRLDLELDNIARASIDVARAELDSREVLTVPVDADRNGRVLLEGRFSSGTRVLQDGQPVRDAKVGASGVALPVEAGEHTYTIVPPGQGGR